jgi:hypothetical protein
VSKKPVPEKVSNLANEEDKNNEKVHTRRNMVRGLGFGVKEAPDSSWHTPIHEPRDPY